MTSLQSCKHCKPILEGWRADKSFKASESELKDVQNAMLQASFISSTCAWEWSFSMHRVKCIRLTEAFKGLRFLP